MSLKPFKNYLGREAKILWPKERRRIEESYILYPQVSPTDPHNWLRPFPLDASVEGMSRQTALAVWTNDRATMDETETCQQISPPCKTETESCQPLSKAAQASILEPMGKKPLCSPNFHPISHSRGFTFQPRSWLSTSSHPSPKLRPTHHAVLPDIPTHTAPSGSSNNHHPSSCIQISLSLQGSKSQILHQFFTGHAPPC